VGDFVGGARQALMMLRSTLALSAEEESLHSRTLMMPRSTLALVLNLSTPGTDMGLVPN
jgi:hypothetical protein